jgi:hypothetical protein
VKKEKKRRIQSILKLEAKNYAILIIYLEEKKLWSIEKLVIEFRKLFNDKTTFMNLYSSSTLLAKSNFEGEVINFNPIIIILGKKTE